MSAVTGCALTFFGRHHVDLSVRSSRLGSGYLASSGGLRDKLKLEAIEIRDLFVTKGTGRGKNGKHLFDNGFRPRSALDRLLGHHGFRVHHGFLGITHDEFHGAIALGHLC